VIPFALDQALTTWDCRLGMVKAVTSVIPSISTAAQMNTDRHPKWAAMRLETGRAKRTPNSKPPMMPPTTRQRDSLDAKCAARGIRICTETELKPISNDAINRPLGLSVMPASVPDSAARS